MTTGREKPVIAICLEASHERGMGHLFRAMALAKALAKLGATSTFYLNDFKPAVAILRDQGLQTHVVSLADTDSGWETALVREDGVSIWIDDRLDTGSRHASTVRAAGPRLVSFDDRGSGGALADLNVVAFPATDDEVLPGRRVLKGLDHLVLDPALALHRRLRRSLGSTVVSMGGSDTYGLTVEIVRALRDLGRVATVVVGPGFAHDRELAAVLGPGFDLRRSVRSLPAEFARHDLAITAGGLTPCEANAAGLPVIVIAAEPWEARTAEVLARYGGAIYAGPRNAIDLAALDRDLPIETMSRAALAAVPVDGADRVAREILALHGMAA